MLIVRIYYIYNYFCITFIYIFILYNILLMISAIFIWNIDIQTFVWFCGIYFIIVEYVTNFLNKIFFNKETYEIVIQIFRFIFYIFVKQYIYLQYLQKFDFYTFVKYNIYCNIYIYNILFIRSIFTILYNINYKNFCIFFYILNHLLWKN